MLERLFTISSTQDALAGERLYLRAPEMHDFEPWFELRRKSKDFLVPWEPTWAPDELTRGAFRHRVRRYARNMREDRNYGYFIFLNTGRLVGGITLSNVRRGVAQTGSVGYWLGEPHIGKGYMTEALNCLLAYCFDTLELNRIEAACLPNNSASIALLGRTGFTHEGYSRKYLKINGSWRDHLLFARLAED